MTAAAFTSAVLVLYALVGVACAAVARGRGARDAQAFARTSAGEVAFALVLWPLWLPLSLGARVPAAASTAAATALGASHPATASLVAALARVEGSPLAPLLPDQATVRRLAAKLAEVSARIEELDDVLARPAFDLPAARARHAELASEPASASAEALASASLRVQNIERLRDLRTRFVAEVDDINELLSQLVIQVEVVRFVGATQDGTEDGTRDLLRELLARVEGLGQMLDDRPALRPLGAST
jgi:hypothetical protein